MFDRLDKLIGEEARKEIEGKKVLLIGVGGVGGFALEALVRSGFNNITIVDYDTIDESNLNRQIITNEKNLGKIKVEETLLRAKSIRSNICINPLNIKLTDANLVELLDNKYDYIIDDCDDLEIKFLLIKYSMKYNYKLISSMGTAKKTKPELLSITTLDKTFNDPIARILRSRVKKEHINTKVHVVSSTETIKEVKEKGTCILVPSVAGILCASYIFNDIISSSSNN